MSTQLALDFDGCADGRTYDHARDHGRLSNQRARVAMALAMWEWWTLAELAHAAGGSEASVSARLRDLRKPQYGSHVVARRYRGDGVWEYRMEGQP